MTINPDIPQVASGFLGIGGVIGVGLIVDQLRKPTGIHRVERRPAVVEVAAGAPEAVPYAGFHGGHTTVETALGLIVMGFRYCPAELQTVAAVIHPDGSATCADDDCGAHIPATEEGAL
jgi:hypothetical protein